MAANTMDAHESALADWLGRKQHHDRLRFGVSFTHLSCHGFAMGDSSRYQSTVTSWALVIPKFIINLVTRRPKQKVQILHWFNGLIQPGEMLLVLGRPGSGCSTFLKTLAGDTHGFHVDMNGAGISYSGIPYEMMHRKFKGECLYLAEQDLHFPELTLGETLAFAARARENTLGKDSAKVARTAASLFHLDGAFDTKIGDAMIRGLSGGEKKRASIAEAFLSDAQLQCWDGSTRGLDSSTALRFIRLLRRCTDALLSTVAMSVYQASEDMYASFDKVTLLYEGRQIFFGPVDTAAEYFIRLGFVRPRRATTADFLTSLTHPAERIVREGFEDTAPRTPDEFFAAWIRSDEARGLERDIQLYERDHQYRRRPRWPACGQWRKKFKTIESQIPRLMTTTYPLSLLQQVSMCLWRSFIRMRNNLTPVISGVIGQVVLAVIIGSVYYNLEPTTASFEKRAILLYFGLMLNAFSPAFEIYTIRHSRPLIETHARYALYHPSTDALATFLSTLPTKALTALLTNLPLYFMTSLRRTTTAFLTFLLFMLVCTLTMSLFFRMLGSLSRTLEETMAPVAAVVMLFVVYAGYVVPQGEMRPWLGWVRWVDPVFWGYEGLMVNEFAGREFPCADADIVPQGLGYAQEGMEGRVCAVIGAVPGEESVQGSAYLEAKFGFVREHLWRNLGILFAIMLIFGAIHLLATELIPARRSRGEILLFKRTRKKKQRAEFDVEAPTAVNFSQDTSQLESVNGDDLGYDTKTKGVVEAIQVQSSVFHWSGLSYDIKTKTSTRRILNNIDGWVKPGTLTALMGVTGAGKTTLLDVLADRATAGSVSGDVSIDGRPRDATFGRRIGYVQQEDIHMPTATVREALEFSALLRQSGRRRSDGEKLEYVGHVLELLEMTDYADAIVGVPGEGLNVEQRKRLTIAVEMVARPELLLFLDEPTSGLDSQTAWSICKLLRRLADNGQAVLCTIHQPSSQLFEMFDRLLLLERGGNELYFGEIGPDAATLIDYFESNGAPRCPPGANPAEWMVEVTRTAATETETGEGKVGEGLNWPERWSNSPEKLRVRRELVELKTTLPPLTPVSQHHGGAYAAPFHKQLAVVLRRSLRDYWRDPLYLYSRFGLCICVSLANSLSTLSLPASLQSLTTLLFSLFLTTQLFSPLNQQITPRFHARRALFEARELRARSHAWAVFLADLLLLELLFITLAGAMVFAVWFYPTGMWRNGAEGFGAAERAGLVACLVWAFCAWSGTLSVAMAAGVGDAETAVNLAVLVYWISLVFCGVLVAPGELPGFWRWVYRAVPLTYLVNGMAVAGLGGTAVVCSAVEMVRVEMPRGVMEAGRTCGEYLGSYVSMAGGYVEDPGARGTCGYCPIAEADTVLRALGMRLDNPWRNVGYMAVYVMFNVLAAFALYWLARVPKGKSGKN